jgi:thiol-disulfide isomerase/thioredoxin
MTAPRSLLPIGMNMDLPSEGGRPPERSSTRTWLAIGLAATIAWVVFLATAGPIGGDGRAPSLEAPSPPAQAEFGWSLLDLDGSPVDFGKYRGKTIVLNLWATWCAPCLQEMPSIASLAADKRLKDREVVFLCVSVDRSAETLRRFVREKSWKMTVLRATSIPDIFTTEGIPATFLIGPDGRIAAAQVGAAKWDDPSVVDFLEKLARPAR